MFKKTILTFFLVFNFFLISTVFGQTVGDYRSTGDVTFAAATNWQIYNGSIWVSATIAPNVASYTTSNIITVRTGHAATISATATIVAQLTVLGTFTLNSGASLSIGSMYVDSSGNAVVVNAGSALTVNGNFTVKKGDMDVAGTVYIDGNFSTETGNVDVVGGGSMDSSGSMNTQGDSTIFGSKNPCEVGPCSGTSLNCQSVISPTSQTICQTSQSALITFTKSGATVVKWQSTTDFLTFTDIANTTTTLPAQTLAQTTRFRVVYTVSSGCSGQVNSPYATVIVNQAPTTAAAGVDQSKCNTATFTLAGNNPTIGTGTWTVFSGTATITTPTSYTSGVTGVTGGTSATLRWTISNGSCASTDDVVLTNNTVPAPPTGSSSQSFCSGATVFNLAATGTAIKWYAAASGGTALATTTALVNGTHYYASQTIGCESTSRLDVTAIVNTTNTWTGTNDSSWFNAGNWSCGSVPIASSDVVIPNVTKKPIIDDTSKIALANTLTVESGSSLTVINGNTIKVTNAVTVNAPGTLTFEDSASLVQINDVTNSGSIKYNRNYTGGEEDYTYWSSPVALQNLSVLSPKTKGDKFFSFSGTDWVQENPVTTTMTIGKGYIIRGIPPPSGIPPGFDTVTFIGVPNNGPQSITVSGGGTSNLIGNPYPSALDADAFILENTEAIDGTLYFWTHNTPIAIGTPDPGTGVYAYSGNDYATYTLSGGVGTAGNLTAPEWVDANNNKIVDTGEWTDTNGNNIVDAVEWVDANNNKVVDSGEWTDSNGDNILNLEVEQVSNRPIGKIAAGQGFFTTSTTTGSLVTFTNAMRIDGSGNSLNNSNFYKTKNPKAKISTNIEKNRVWLNLTNKEGAFKQTLVGYITGATNTWDKLYDGESFDGNDFLDFYSINEDKNLTIQGRVLPFDENDEVSLGYRIAVEGTFTISIDETDGMLANQAVFIEDKLTNTVFDLKSGNYTFNTVAGTFNDRFVLRYTNKTLGKEEVELNDGIIALYSNNYKTLIVRNNVNDATVNTVELFNLLGQSIANWDVNDNEQTNIQIPIKNTDSGIYIVKIKTTKGEFSKKIIIK